eukprot:31328-Pelagococcus_subviridis.AAC.12
MSSNVGHAPPRSHAARSRVSDGASAATASTSASPSPTTRSSAAATTKSNSVSLLPPPARGVFALTSASLWSESKEKPVAPPRALPSFSAFPHASAVARTTRNAPFFAAALLLTHSHAAATSRSASSTSSTARSK